MMMAMMVTLIIQRDDVFNSDDDWNFDCVDYTEYFKTRTKAIKPWLLILVHRIPRTPPLPQTFGRRSHVV